MPKNVGPDAAKGRLHLKTGAQVDTRRGVCRRGDLEWVMSL
jgi:hypothetical protein